MNCPNCGAALPDGSTYCPICAMPIQGNQPNGSMMFQQPAPSRKKAALVGIIISAVVVLAITFLLGFFVLGGRYNGTYMLDPDCKYNGTYMIDSVSLGEWTLPASDLASFGMDDIGIKVSFDECSFVGGESLGLDSSDTSRIEFIGDTVIITDNDGTTAEGSLDGNSIIIESDGLLMKFTRTSNLTPDDMSKLGIKVSFGKCSLIGKDAFDLGRRPKLRFSDDTVTIRTSDGTRTKGSFDGKSFTIELDGTLIKFTKK